MDTLTLEETQPDIYENGPTEAMHQRFEQEIEKYGGYLPWTGEWPGDAECREFGWYAKLVPGQGWVSCDRSDPAGTEDLNRLYRDAVWSREQKRFVLKESL